MKNKYLMENPEEVARLEMKTEESALARQALWAGLKEGMRVVDIGCGPGKTTSLLKKLVGESGEVIGVDFSEVRIDHANKKYKEKGLSFVCRDIFDDLKSLGKFDFVWSRFFLEYHRSNAYNIVKIIGSLLKRQGIVCLVDLDYNCLTHYGIPEKVESTIEDLMKYLEINHDFDPFIGRKLYSFIYELGYERIDLMMEPHHLIFGELNEVDAFNWHKKAIVAGKSCGYGFKEYPGGFNDFLKSYEEFFYNPKRFTYTPLIACRGVKP
jgi:SAM-dependent methyltransferase